MPATRNMFDSGKWRRRRRRRRRKEEEMEAPSLQASAAAPWQPARLRSARRNGRGGAHPMKGDALRRKKWISCNLIRHGRAVICFCLTSFVYLPELCVTKVPAVFFSVVHLPSLQIVEQFPCPGIMKHKDSFAESEDAVHQNDRRLRQRRRRPVESRCLALSPFVPVSSGQVEDAGAEAVRQSLRKIGRHRGAEYVEAEEQVHRRADEELRQAEDSDRQPRHLSSENPAGSTPGTTSTFCSSEINSLQRGREDNWKEATNGPPHTNTSCSASNKDSRDEQVVETKGREKANGPLLLPPPHRPYLSLSHQHFEEEKRGKDDSFLPFIPHNLPSNIGKTREVGGG
ncbi:hypothetical protein GW17_00056675 [Ensete ventricosum]|nr:hypothetical protein GW17_00056675 [Ensete ventricosum]